MKLHPIIEKRYSPRSFAQQEVTPHQLELLLEAARRSPSAGNNQAWRLMYGFRGEEAFELIADTLQDNNRHWAPNAPLLIAMCANELNAKGNKHFYAMYEAGIASAWLTVQAIEMNMFVHQMAGFDKEKLRQNLALPEHIVPFTIMAVGYLGHPDALSPELPESYKLTEVTRSPRKPLSEIAFHGKFGEGMSLGKVVL